MAEMAQALRLEFARRDLILAGAGAIAEGIAVNRPALAQSAPPPALASAGPGMVDVERRGVVLLIGINRPQVQNRMDALIIIGLGKALY